MMEKHSLLNGKRVLMVLAHCDDELVCGWPILQNPKIKKTIVIVSSDRKNKQRQWCSHRKFVTADLCKSLGIDFYSLDYDSEFYRLNHRDGKLAKVEMKIVDAIKKFSFDYLFTHNPHGEYGHLDHIFIANLIFRAVDCPILMTDLTISADWSKSPPITSRYSRSYYANSVDEILLDRKFYQHVMRFYETRGAWTWSQEPAEKCGLFLV